MKRRKNEEKPCVGTRWRLSAGLDWPALSALKQMDKLTKEMNQRLRETVDQEEEVADQLKQVVDNMADSECWDIGVKYTLVQEKVSDMEAHARHRNFRIYGVPENSEGSSVTAFDESLIKDQIRGLPPGIERAHCAPRQAQS